MGGPESKASVGLRRGDTGRPLRSTAATPSTCRSHATPWAASRSPSKLSTQSPASSVGAVSLTGDTVETSGYWLGWFDLDASRRVLGSESFRVAAQPLYIRRMLPSAGRYSSKDRRFSWCTVRTGASIRIEPPSSRPPTVLAAKQVPSRRHVIAVGDGDWKIGPPSYVAVVVVESDQLTGR